MNSELWLKRATWRQVATVTIPLAVMPAAIWFTLSYPEAAQFFVPDPTPPFAAALRFSGWLILAAAAVFAIVYSLAMFCFRAAVRSRPRRRDRLRIPLEALYALSGIGALVLLFLAWPVWMILAAALLWLAAGCALRWRLARQAGIAGWPPSVWPVAALLALPPVLAFGAMRISAEYHQARAAERLEAIYAGEGGFVPYSEMARLLPPVIEDGAEYFYRYLEWKETPPAATEALNAYYTSPSDERRDAMIAAHAEILPVIDKLGEFPQARFRRDWSRSFHGMLLPELSHMRALGQLQKLRMIAAAEAGDFQLAEQLWRALGNYRSQLNEDPLLISGLVAIAVEGIRTDGFMTCLNDDGPLPEEWLRAVIADAPQAEAGFRAAHRRTIHTEIAIYLATDWEKLCRGYDILRFLTYDQNIDQYGRSLYADSATFRKWFAAVNLDRFLEITAPAYAEAGLDWNARGEAPDAGNELPFLLADTLGDGRGKVASAYSSIYGKLRGVAAMAALELYRDRYGDYPESLEALVPEFLTQVPLNPFDGKPLRYEIQIGGGPRRIEITCDSGQQRQPLPPGGYSNRDTLLRVIGEKNGDFPENQ